MRLFSGSSDPIRSSNPGLRDAAGSTVLTPLMRRCVAAACLPLETPRDGACTGDGKEGKGRKSGHMQTGAVRAALTQLLPESGQEKHSRERVHA